MEKISGHTRFGRLTSNPYFLAPLSGFLLVLSFPPFDLHFLAWVALVPFLFALTKVKREREKKWKLTFCRTQLLGALLGIVFYYGTLYWIYNIFGFLGFLLIFILVVYTSVYAYLLGFLFSKWKNNLVHIFSPAILWVAIEYFKSEGWWAKFAWMNLGYSQHNFAPILQFASLFGQYGISFLIVLVNSAIVFVLLNRNNKKLVAVTVTAAVLSLGILVSWGVISSRETYGSSIRVGLVQDESSELSTYVGLTERLPGDTGFILWPEYAVPEFLEERPDSLNQVQVLAREKSSYLILGSKERAETYSSDLKVRMMRESGYPENAIDDMFKFHNTAYLFSPKGEIIGKYHKTNPIQFFADGVAGEDFPVFETEFGPIGILICYDADYSYVARNLVRNGAEILFIPTYDAIGWSELQHRQHSAMTSMRAVENGRFVARATTSGISQIIDPTGEITDSIGFGEQGIATGLVERIDRRTFYTAYGYVLPYLCIVVLLAMLFAAFRKERFGG